MTSTETSQIADLKKCVDDLEGFEESFVSDMMGRPETYMLSEKQADKLEQIWRKHCQD
jgi:hypothetical protein